MSRLHGIPLAIVLVGFCWSDSSANDQGWIELFDGRTTQGWTPRGEAQVSVVDGELQIRSTPNVWVVTDRKMTNFVLEVEAKVSDEDGVNSGVAFRCQGETGRPKGYQCEIDTSARAWTGGLHAIGKGWIHPQADDRESIHAFLQQSQGSFNRNDWTRFRIVCQEDWIRIYTNGVLTTDVHDDLYRSGYVGLQNHGGGGVNRFRAIRMKPIDQRSDADQPNDEAEVQ